MHFIVYVPAGGSLEAVGLQHLVAGSAYTHCRRGPDAGPGTLYTWRNTPPHYDPEHQDWIPAAVDQRYWLGFRKDDPPRPSELQRGTVHGTTVVLGDGFEWTVPREASLPRECVFGQQGEWTFVLRRELSAFEQLADEWRSRLMEIGQEGSRPVLYSELCEFVTTALEINYRITPEVASRLRLFQTGEGESLLRAAMAITALGGE